VSAAATAPPCSSVGELSYRLLGFTRETRLAAALRFDAPRPSGGAAEIRQGQHALTPERRLSGTIFRRLVGVAFNNCFAARTTLRDGPKRTGIPSIMPPGHHRTAGRECRLPPPCRRLAARR